MPRYPSGEGVWIMSLTVCLHVHSRPAGHSTFLALAVDGGATGPVSIRRAGAIGTYRSQSVAAIGVIGAASPAGTAAAAVSPGTVPGTPASETAEARSCHRRRQHRQNREHHHPHVPRPQRHTHTSHPNHPRQPCPFPPRYVSPAVAAQRDRPKSPKPATIEVSTPVRPHSLVSGYQDRW